MGLIMVLLLVVSIVLMVLATSLFKLHPFIALIFAALFVGLGASALGQFDVMAVETTLRNGFGGILAYIGIVIVLGTIIGVFLEKSGAAVKMADTILKLVGPKRPGLAMSFIGWFVSIPVFCDSGYVILSALRKSVTRKAKVSATMMSVALATGLYASHTLVPPTPGPIAAAGNLGLEDSLGLVILVGIFVSLFTMIAGFIWAKYIGGKITIQEDRDNEEFFKNGFEVEEDLIEKTYGKLPSTFMSFAPILIPIFFIAMGTIASFPGDLMGTGFISNLFKFFGKPVMALLVGLLFALGLAPKLNEEVLMKWIGEGVKIAGPIILITGAGGAFGAIIKATPVADFLGQSMSGWSVGILVPFFIAAALKTAQGSSTTALVTTSALMAPLLVSLGLDSTMGAVLTVMSIGAGAMTVSHANDSYFWVVAEFTGMDVKTAYKSQTVATLIQGVVGIIVVFILSLFLL
ncbi:GntP family permease [Oceanispirochaeta crateris]|uniref:GntP family permease n=1 Tax=Oceanispirochaeta crateris TaxID=2518645 RepID=A0A5C1QHV1_9SPIO|nr:GntP family permease [Oceanispirochaeta crateris]QEN06858.1 GntP family permease [Oceanispirochaeta crateris]